VEAYKFHKKQEEEVYAHEAGYSYLEQEFKANISKKKEEELPSLKLKRLEEELTEIEQELLELEKEEMEYKLR